MKINNLKILLIGIVATWLFNMVVLSNFNPLFIGSAYTYIYLIIVPGFFIQRLLRMQGISFFESLAYIVGFSIAYLLQVGIGTNLLGLLPQITHPLNQINCLIVFDIYTAILLLINYFREKDSSIHITFPRVTFIQLFFYITPFFFPLLSILGVDLLNSNGVNTLVMIMLFSIALYTFVVAVFWKNLGDFHFEMPIYLIAISLLFMFSLRSSYIIGWDVYQEYKVFWLTESHQMWSMANYMDAYNACLSITILPTVFHYFTQVSDPYVFKTLFQCTFAFTPITIYGLARRFADRLVAYLATFFFMATLDFFRELPALDRQEIAYIFFGLLLLTLFNKQVAPLQKKLLFLIFSISIVLSHYSTAYILIALFGMACAYLTIHKEIVTRFLHKTVDDFTLKPLPVAIFIIFAIIWFGGVTRTSGNILNTFYQASINLTNVGQQAPITSIFDQLLSSGGESLQDQLNDQVKEGPADYSQYHFIYYPKSTYQGYTPTVIDKDILPSHVSDQVSNIIDAAGDNINKIMKLLIFLGFAATVILARKKLFTVEYSVLSIGFVIALILITAVPQLSSFYPIGRLDQQTLFLIALPAILSASWLLRFIPYRARLVLLTVLVIGYALFTNTFIPQLTGGQDPEVILNNSGLYYNEIYLHSSEVASIHWLDVNNKEQLPVFADVGSYEKMQGYSDQQYVTVNVNVFPSLIDQNGYVYANYANTLDGIGIQSPKDARMEYNFPNDFLNNNKNLVYSNYYTHIYR